MTTSEPTLTGPESTSSAISRLSPLAECESCPLYTPGGGRFTAPLNFPDAKIAVVGDSPGYKDNVAGRLFTGPGGQLLHTVLNHHGIEDVWLTTTCLCRGKETDPPKEAIKACRPRLIAELEALENLEVIVTLGNTATQNLMNTTTGISSLRAGPPKDSPIFDGVKVIPTVHPAFCLRTADAFPHLVADIGKINADVIEWKAPEFVVFDEATQAVAALIQLRHQYDEIVIDIEVGIEKDTDFGHPDQYQMLCIGFCYAPGKAIVIGEEALQSNRVKSAVRQLLEDPTKKWIAHNGKFDLAGLWSWGQAQLYFDTMLASYALDERPGIHGLKYLAGEFLGAPPYDDVIRRYVGKGESYANVPRDILYEYNAYDVACTFALYQIFTERLEEDGLRRVHDFLVRASDALMHSEMEGIAINVPHLDTLTEMYLEKLEVLEQELKDITEIPTFNPRSPLQVKNWLHEQGAKVPGTDVEILTLLAERTPPDSKLFTFLDTLLRHRKEQKQYGTYVKGVRKRLHHGRIHSSFLLHGTTTGRLASRNPNLQNVPRASTPSGAALRALFVPTEGNVFVQADYGQIELRVAAILSGDEYLIGVFSDPSRDLFDEIGVGLYGEAALDPTTRKELRIRTKAYVYGVGYGREAFSIAQEFRIGVEEAQRGLAEYFELVPQLAQWREDIKKSILTESADLVTPLGRHRRFWLINNENKMDVIKEGLAFLPQSTASDVTLHALCTIREAGYNVRIPVHDSILVECAEADADDVTAFVVSTMERTAAELLGDSVPFIAEASVGWNWSQV